MKNLRLLAIGAASLGLAAAVLPRLAPSILQFNDATAETDVVMKGGHAYVPVTAVAKLLNATVQVDGSTYKFVPLDNSRQVNGNEGKIGDMIRLGYGNVTVTSLNVGTTYKAQHGGSDATADVGKKIVAIGLHLQNSTLKTQMCVVMGGDNTALADTMGRSYAASSFSDFGNRGTELLPGAAVDITLLFNVNSDVEVKDLVYALDFAAVTQVKTARIHLQTAAPAGN